MKIKYLKRYKIYTAIFFLIFVIFFFVNSLYPTPKKVILENKTVTIGSNWSIAVDILKEQDLFTANYLKQKLLDKFSFSLFIESVPPQDVNKHIFLGNFDDKYIKKLVVQEKIKIPEGINEEGYVLHSSCNRIVIIAKSSKGIFYGVQTLLQLIEKKGENLILPEGDIQDYPDIKIRAVHLFAANPQEIKHQLEKIAKLKFNALIIDSRDFFNLDEGDNKEKWQEIFEYARQLHIEPIPELQSFGYAGFLLSIDPHAAEGIWVNDAEFKFINNVAIPQKPKESPLVNIIRTEESDILITSLDKKKTYKENKDYKIVDDNIFYPYSTDVKPTKILRIPSGKIESGQTVLVSYNYVVRKCSFSKWSIPYCPSSERTYKIMESTIKNVIEILRPKYISIGHDEIRGMNRDSRCLRRNLSNAQLLAEDINRLYSIAKKYDPELNLLMWSDMLNPWHNGGDENYQVQFGGKKGATAPAIDFIPQDIIILLWNQSRENLLNAPSYFKSKGFTCWLNGTKWLDAFKSKNECTGIMVTTWEGFEKNLKDLKETAEVAW